MQSLAIQKIFKKCIKKVGLDPAYSIHITRHTYGTLLYQKTKDLRLIQKQLGHASIKTTEIYADVLAEDILKTLKTIPVEVIVT